MNTLHLSWRVFTLSCARAPLPARCLQDPGAAAQLEDHHVHLSSSHTPPEKRVYQSPLVTRFTFWISGVSKPVLFTSRFQITKWSNREHVQGGAQKQFHESHSHVHTRIHLHHFAGHLCSVCVKLLQNPYRNKPLMQVMNICFLSWGLP